MRSAETYRGNRRRTAREHAKVIKVSLGHYWNLLPMGELRLKHSKATLAIKAPIQDKFIHGE